MKLRYVVALVLIPGVLATAPAPAGSGADVGALCGMTIQIHDPGLRASFERFDRAQSTTAAKLCALYRTDTSTLVASR